MWKKLKTVVFEDETDLQKFMQALDVNNIDTVKRFLRNGMDPNSCLKDFQTGLHIGAQNNYFNLLKILLTQPTINVNARDDFGRTPLYFACLTNNINTVKLLISCGADVNIPNKNESTPLLSSVQNSFPDMVNILLENKADPNMANTFGKTPLYLAIVESPNEEIAVKLANYEADPNVNNGIVGPILVDSALNCRSFHQISMIKLLIDVGGNINIQDLTTGSTALHMTAITGYLPLTEFLVENGANIRLRDCSRRTALDLAKKLGNKEIVQYLADEMRKSLRKSTSLV